MKKDSSFMITRSIDSIGNMYKINNQTENNTVYPVPLNSSGENMVSNDKNLKEKKSDTALFTYKKIENKKNMISSFKKNNVPITKEINKEHHNYKNEETKSFRKFIKVFNNFSYVYVFKSFKLFLQSYPLGKRFYF